MFVMKSLLGFFDSVISYGAPVAVPVSSINPCVFTLLLFLLSSIRQTPLLSPLILVFLRASVLFVGRKWDRCRELLVCRL
jgi:hypothetical protein